MNPRQSILVAVLLLFAAVLHAQPYKFEWVKHFGSFTNDVASNDAVDDYSMEIYNRREEKIFITTDGAVRQNAGTCLYHPLHAKRNTFILQRHICADSLKLHGWFNYANFIV